MEEDYKKRVKRAAIMKGKTLKEIYEFLDISQVAFNKYLRNDNLPYSKRIRDIANFLEVPLTDLIGEQNINNQVNDQSEVINQSIAKNNFFSDEKTELAVLRAENEQLKKIIDKQDEEIRFLRGQLMKQ